MTGNAVAIREPNQLTNEQLSYIANTEFVPQGLRGNKPAILACVMTGRALGLDDMSSLRLIHVVNGRPTFSAELMVQIIRRHGHSISGATKDGSCTVVGTRKDTGDTMEVTWTLEMAQRAGLANKAVWKAYPEALLWARAVSQLSRQLFADCFAGGTYTPEEAPEADYVELEDSAGVPQTEETAVSTVPAAPTPEGDQPSPAETPSAAQVKKLNVLVGTLREAGRVTTEDVYAQIGHDPVVASEGGELHWSPLRDTLTKPEASKLIEWLTELEANGGMTMNALIKHVGETPVDPSAIRAAIGRLFPGRSRASELSDVERGVLWGEVSGG